MNKKANLHFKSAIKEINILPDSKRSQTKIITTLLLILLVLSLIVVIWRVIDASITEGAEEVPGTTGCLTIDLEIRRVDNGSSDNLILKRGGGIGELAGIKVYIGNRSENDYHFIEILSIPDLPDPEIRLDITSKTVKENSSSPGYYIKIAKLIGADIETARVCEFDGKSARYGVMIVSNATR